ncbi:MAG: copper resistance CopC family protein, partial [Solirubrobacterales bacterium]
PLALTALALTLVGAGAVSAHTTVKSTNPKSGRTVSKSLKSVKVTFNGQIKRGTLKVVRSRTGAKVSKGSGGRNPGNVKQLTVRLKGGLKRGGYKASWSIVAADGHKQSGSFKFKLK